jgi:hypothetical protein
MTLYIANTTKQNWNHHFRVPEMKRPYFVQIPSGAQVQIERKFGPIAEDMIIEQLQKYGGRNANEVSGKLEAFPGIFYRQAKPIGEDEIVAGHDKVVENQEKRSAAEATRAALGFDASKRDRKNKKRLVQTTEVEVIQDVPRNEKPTGDEVHLHLTVAHDGASNVKLPGF